MSGWEWRRRRWPRAESLHGYMNLGAEWRFHRKNQAFSMICSVPSGNTQLEVPANLLSANRQPVRDPRFCTPPWELECRITAPQDTCSWKSPAFPNPSRGQAVVGSTHYFTAYVAVNGSYPPLRTRIDPGDNADAASAENHDTVVSLMHKAQIVGHKDRPAFAPRITIQMAGGNVYQGEYQGNELEWGLDTEVERLQPLFPQINWPAEKLDAVVAAVRDIPTAADMGQLIAAATS